MIGRLVNLYYTTLGTKLFMNYVIRRLDDTPEGSKHHIKGIPAGLSPYGFVPASYKSAVEEIAEELEMEVDFNIERSERLDGGSWYFADSDRAVLQVRTHIPRGIGNLHRSLVDRGLTDCYEMDFRYKLRHMVDKQYGLFVAIDDDYQGTTALPVEELEETKLKLPDYNWVYLDVENDDRFGIGEFRKARLLVIRCMDKHGNAYEFMDLSEEKMLTRLVEFLHQFDFILHWTNYDKEAIEKRCKACDVDIDMREWLWLDFQRIITSRHPDFQGNRRLALDEFGKRALGMGKLELTKGFYDTWVEDPHVLSRYCHEDVNLMWLANEKFKFVELEIALGEMLGLPIDELTRPTVLVTKRALEKSFQRTQRPIWRCRPPASKGNEKKKKRGFTGATVIEPIPGFYHNVAIMDFASLYNNVMQMWQMSPEQWNPKTKKFDRFPGTKGVFVEMLEEYTAKRQEYTNSRNLARVSPIEGEWDRWEMYRKAIKVPILINWGVIGKKESRFFIKDVAQMIVDRAKLILQSAITLIQTSKTKVSEIYGDTDSVMVAYPEYFYPDQTLITAQKLTEHVTYALRAYLTAKMGISDARAKLLNFGVEAIFKTFLLGDVKKKYSGAMIWQDGKGFIKPELYIRGHHSRRGETCDFIRELQTTLLKYIHAEFDITSIIEYLKTLKRELFQGNHDEALIMQVGLRRKLDTYTKSNAPYVRVARELDRLGRWRDGSKVRYYYVDENTVHPHAEGVERLPIQAGGYIHLWNNRVMSWVPALLAPFISETKLIHAMEGQTGLEAFL